MSLLNGRHPYLVVVPLFSAFIWFFTLFAMLLTLLITGRPKYVPQQTDVAYISDIGASFLKPLFVVACCITGSGLLISLTIERLLRHKGRLLPDLHARERTLSFLAIVGAFIAMIGLACLSGFDVKQYRIAHYAFLFVFMVGVSLSTIFTVAEFGWLANDYPEVERMKWAYVAKAVIVLTLVASAIVCGATAVPAPNVGGVFEWLIGFGFTFYLLTFAYDLWSAKIGVDREGMVEIP